MNCHNCGKVVELQYVCELCGAREHADITDKIAEAIKEADVMIEKVIKTKDEYKKIRMIRKVDQYRKIIDGMESILDVFKEAVNDHQKLA
jgi:hypothetical protein